MLIFSVSPNSVLAYDDAEIARYSLDSLVRNPFPVEYLSLDIPLRETNTMGIQVVLKAQEYLGHKYGRGCMGPQRFDCSGFTSYIFSHFGIRLNRSSAAQVADGMPIDDPKRLQPGDLVFYNGHRIGSRIGHVGIVTEVDAETGCFRFIHAAMTGIQYDSSEAAYYKVRYMGARRIFHN